MEYPSSHNGFSKLERLHRKKDIQDVFVSGFSFSAYPLRIFYRIQNIDDLHKIVISVPKRNIPRAVDRNTIKRRIREAYRVNKEYLAAHKIPSLHIAVLYTSKEISTFKLIEDKVILSLHKIIKNVLKNLENTEPQPPQN